MSKKLRILTVSFDTEIRAEEVPAFRGALAEKVGIEHDWFHNHDNSPDAKSGYFYRYPLIQYKRHWGKPMLVCINNGVEEAHKFFSKPNWDMTISGKFHKMGIDTLRVHAYDLRVQAYDFQYYLRNWLALNQRNYLIYKGFETEEEGITFLEKILTTHIINFASGVDWRIKERVKVKITSLDRIRSIRSKKTRQMTFSLSFKSNVFLPNYIGIGKSTSRGFGVVTEKRKA
ncbi:MAG: CRISPR-associated endonuclease Cas6 [Flavobacteriales bacterium]